MPRTVKGLERGLVDGNYSADDCEAWAAWAEGIIETYPEATLLQLIALTERGSFDGDYLAANEGDE